MENLQGLGLSEDLSEPPALGVTFDSFFEGGNEPQDKFEVEHDMFHPHLQKG